MAKKAKKAKPTAGEVLDGPQTMGDEGVPSAVVAAGPTVAGLPVKGYLPQSTDAVALVNEHKEMEEVLLRRIDFLFGTKERHDQRWLAIAKTHFEQGFMALNRAVFKPRRINLPGDAKE